MTSQPLALKINISSGYKLPNPGETGFVLFSTSCVDKVRLTFLELTQQEYQPLEWHGHRVLETRMDWVEDLFRPTDGSKEQEQQFITKQHPSHEQREQITLSIFMD